MKNKKKSLFNNKIKFIKKQNVESEKEIVEISNDEKKHIDKDNIERNKGLSTVKLSQDFMHK